MSEVIYGFAKILGNHIPTAIALIAVGIALTIGSYKEKIERIENENVQMHQVLDRLSVGFYDLRDEVHQLRVEMHEDRNK